MATNSQIWQYLNFLVGSRDTLVLSKKLNYLISDIAWLKYDPSKENWASLAMEAILVARYELGMFGPCLNSHVQLLAKILNVFLNMGYLCGFPLNTDIFMYKDLVLRSKFFRQIRWENIKKKGA